MHGRVGLDGWLASGREAESILSLPPPSHQHQPQPPKQTTLTDVVNVEQAKIAEEAGAVAVMALERIPADIRRDGGVARMSDPAMIKEIKAAVTIPVMAKVWGWV